MIFSIFFQQGLELVYRKIILILQKYLFWSYSESRQIKHSVPGSHQILLFAAEKWKKGEFYRRMCNVLGEPCLSKISFIKTTETWVCHNKPESKRYSMKCKRADSLVNKKFLDHRTLKRVLLTVLWDMNGLITFDLFEKGATVNSASYYQLLRKKSPYLLKWPPYK